MKTTRRTNYKIDNGFKSLCITVRVFFLFSLSLCLFMPFSLHAENHQIQEIKTPTKQNSIIIVYQKSQGVSQQLTDIVKHFSVNQSFDKNKYYPDDFSVALNKNIARSLGIKLASNRTIINLIKKAEKNQ